MPGPAAAQWYFLDDREREVVATVLDAVARADRELLPRLTSELGRLEGAARLVTESPPIATSWEPLGVRPTSGEALIVTLARVPDYEFDLHLPTKVVFGQAYLASKINFFKTLGRAAGAADCSAGLVAMVDEELRQSIFTKLAEELLVAILTDAGGPGLARRGAARLLLQVWEEPLHAEIDDFAPLLESAWDARNKVRPVLGSMLGTQEIFRLFQNARDGRFLDYFGSDAVSDEQLEAFEEFLFGLSHEDIAKLRDHMAATCLAVISTDEANRLLGVVPEHWRAGQLGPEALYASYRERRVRASYRALAGVQGPKKTAEEYVMVALLQASQEESAAAAAASGTGAG